MCKTHTTGGRGTEPLTHKVVHEPTRKDKRHRRRTDSCRRNTAADRLPTRPVALRVFLNVGPTGF